MHYSKIQNIKEKISSFYQVLESRQLLNYSEVGLIIEQKNMLNKHIDDLISEIKERKEK